MHQAKKYYEHSGAIGLLGPIYMSVLGAVGALVLGAIYGYAILYIPFVYLNFFMTLIFGAGVGFLVGIGGKLGKVRSSGALLLFGFMCGLLAEYVGWASWIFALSKQEALVLMPSTILRLMQVVSENGAWGVFGWTPTGAAIYIIWGLEAIIIIGASTMMPWAVLSSTPFCERCNKWIEEKESIAPLEPVDNPDELKSRLEQGDYASLTALKKKAKSGAYTQIDLLHCPSCQQAYYLTIKSIVVSVDSDNNEKRDEDNIIENLIITSDHYRTIKEQWEVAPENWTTT